jgi:hypothetical protein
MPTRGLDTNESDSRARGGRMDRRTNGVPLIRDGEETRWLPSRSHFALVRLAVLLGIRGARRPSPEGTIFALDRGQNAFENYAAALWIYATTASFCYGALALVATRVVASLVALAAAPVVLILIARAGATIAALWRRFRGEPQRDNIRLNSVLTMAILGAISLFCLSAGTWIPHAAAVLFLAMVALNAVAAAVMTAFRSRVSEMERQCGV